MPCKYGECPYDADACFGGCCHPVEGNMEKTLEELLAEMLQLRLDMYKREYATERDKKRGNELLEAISVKINFKPKEG